MKLLFDHNLSFRLISTLSELYPGSIHARDVGLHTASDEAVWGYARQHGLTIVTKDVDFHQRSLVFGAPPKVVWIAIGNCSTHDIAVLLQQRHRELLEFYQSPEVAFLVLT